jgi:hypothetical protein
MQVMSDEGGWSCENRDHERRFFSTSEPIRINDCMSISKLRPASADSTADDDLFAVEIEARQGKQKQEHTVELDALPTATG